MDEITITVKVRHGTTTAYQKGCRCDLCRAANAAYQRAYQARRKRQERMIP